MLPDDCAPGQGCHIQDLFKLLGRAHVLSILYTVNVESDGPIRFVDLQKRLRISPNTLSERLKDLSAAGLIERRAFSQIPPRVEYSSTPKGRALRDVFASLHEWTQAYDLTPTQAMAAQA